MAIEPPADDLVTALAMLSDKNGILSQKEFIFRLEENEWAVKKGKGRSSYIEITEEGKNTFETFINSTGI